MIFPRLEINYRKIPIISPGLISVQKAFLLALFSEELNFGGACYQKKFCISKWVSLWFVNKNSYITVDGLIFRRAYYQKDICI